MAYSKLITLKKMVYQGGIVFLSGGVTALISWLSSTTAPEGQAVIFSLALVALKGLENFLKHKNDS